jgi:oligopeptide transport system ATP-binding protein
MNKPVKNSAAEYTVEVDNLKMHFPIRRGILKRTVGYVKALDGVSFKIKKGETLGFVGESGCGKTTVGRCIMQLYKPTGGEIILHGEKLTGKKEAELRLYRRDMSMVFQDPYSSLNPRISSGDIVGEPLKIHKQVRTKNEYNAEVNELFRVTGLSPDMVDRYPHEYSGGQRQRLAIARALAGHPSLIICDEPISALDVSMQAQILNLLKRLQEKAADLSYLFISHDLLAVQYISDRVAVMYLGRIVETANSKELFANTLHPYSCALLSAQPLPDPKKEAMRDRIILTGDVPTPINPPSGCTFHTRCNRVKPICYEDIPVIKDVGGGHCVACHLI